MICFLDKHSKTKIFENLRLKDLTDILEATPIVYESLVKAPTEAEAAEAATLPFIDLDIHQA